MFAPTGETHYACGTAAYTVEYGPCPSCKRQIKHVKGKDRVHCNHCPYQEWNGPGLPIVIVPDASIARY